MDIPHHRGREVLLWIEWCPHHRGREAPLLETSHTILGTFVLIKEALILLLDHVRMCTCTCVRVCVCVHVCTWPAA